MEGRKPLPEFMNGLCVRSDMGETVLRIERLENGYEIEVNDSKIMAENRKPKSQWKNPEKAYAFKTTEEVVAFITEHLDSLEPPPDADEEFGTEFKRRTEKE
jgi:hypothetical protein